MVILILIGAMLLVGVPLYIQYRMNGSPSAIKPLPRAQSSWHHHHPTGKSKGNVVGKKTQVQASQQAQTAGNNDDSIAETKTVENKPAASTTTQSEPSAQNQNQQQEESEVCCGLHEVCEKLATNPTKVEYFDDEELDVFAGRSPESYNDEEIDQFRDVMTTMYPSEVALWRQSLQLRGVALPVELEDEFMLIMSEV